ncbi:MAG: hypothetical protein EOO39_14055 [Cytophagaceae bacterium]|nr:MAG: hypothetical protein EOO39_14055 [Cytophagaceae bacterium]
MRERAVAASYHMTPWAVSSQPADPNGLCGLTPDRAVRTQPSVPGCRCYMMILSFQRLTPWAVSSQPYDPNGLRGLTLDRAVRPVSGIKKELTGLRVPIVVP